MNDESEELSEPEHETSLVDDGGVSDQGFDELLAYLHESRGFDFSGYKRGGLQRRLGKRVSAIGLESFVEYGDYLQVHPEEFGELFNSVLINATAFFRDPSAWEYVVQHIVPKLIQSKSASAPIRIWSAGCATGQEAYTVAMVLADALGLEAFGRRVKIYATDVDDDALNQARQAVYTSKEVVGIPPAALSSYFERSGAKYAFLKELRRAVIFGRHNLFYDAPISKIDLLMCRNTLMYFNADSQMRILSSFHFALGDVGVLFLGKAEMLLTHSTLFAPLDLKRRLFVKLAHGYPRTRPSTSPLLRQEDRGNSPAESRMREAAFEAAPVAQLGFDRSGTLYILNEAARRILGLSQRDLGRAFGELALGRTLDSLRVSIDQANIERRPVQLMAAEWARNSDEPLYFDILVSPMLAQEGSVFGVHVSFVDVTSTRRLQNELQQTTHALEGAHEQLQSTSEELETTNEELQSTVEELETTNEELQSTNEELETTNEELQSTNEELQSMNAELRQRTGEFGRVNAYLGAILASLRSAVIVVDRELRVQIWSDRAQELWGLRADEVRSKHLLNLDIGFPMEKLSAPLRACLAGLDQFEEFTAVATNRRGRPISVSVLLSALSQDGQATGAILLMDEREQPREDTSPSDSN